MNDAIRLTGLWKSDKPTRDGQSFYKGKVQEAITIPAGSMVMLFMNQSDNPKAPKFNVTVLPPRDEYAQTAEPAAGESPGDSDAPW